MPPQWRSRVKAWLGPSKNGVGFAKALPPVDQPLAERSPQWGSPTIRRLMTMRTRHTRTAAATAALAAGVLAAMALQPGAHATQTLAARNPAVEVRTQVIHRTVHVSGGGRHGAGPARGPAGPVGLQSPAASHGGTTRASGSHAGAAQPPPASPVATRPSPGHTSAGGPASSAPPVSTRPSPGHASAGAPASSAPPVSTRPSPGHAGAPASSGAPVSTHTSGSRHGDDHGERRGDD